MAPLQIVLLLDYHGKKQW